MPTPRTGRIEKHRELWRIDVKVHGIRIRKSFATRDLAEAALRETLASVEPDYSARLSKLLGKVTVADVVSQYLERRRPQLELSTMARYDEVVAKHVVPLIGSLDADELVQTPVVLQDFIDGLSWGTARKVLEVLGPALQAAANNGLIPSNPVSKIRRPRRPAKSKKKDIPTPDDVEKIIIGAYEEGLWWGYFVELTATLGLRRGETCALRWEDFTFPARGDKYGRIHIRRAVGKKKGGIYIKAPKSGLARELVVERSVFEGLHWFAGKTGWLFPGRAVRPRRRPDEITRDSSAGRLLHWLDHHGGEVSDKSGRAGADARRAIGVNSSTLSQVCGALLRSGHIERDANARRTFRLALTNLGREAVHDLRALPPEDDHPLHPNSAGARFREMLDRLGIQAPDSRRYGLHSLRHFRATHFFNASRDWVQVAQYLGHTSPAITMELYTNNVVQPTQELLADSAVKL
jgi:integrase